MAKCSEASANVARPQYEVADEFLYARTATAHAAAPAPARRSRRSPGSSARSSRSPTAPDNLLVWGDEMGNHTRCGTCGSLLFSVVRDGEYVHVAMGSLQDEPTIRPTGHIFVGSKAPWFEITDDLPQSDEY